MMMLTNGARPHVTLEHQETILELLCTLLVPLGQYRSEYIQPSKGKRDKKRKRQGPTTHSMDFSPPPAPEIKSYIDVGLAAVTRSLQETASKGQSSESNRPYSAIFVARSGQPNALNCHLPQMVAAASKSRQARAPTRLVGLSKACEDRLSESVGIPRVSCIGLREGAWNSKALVEFTRQHVPIIEAQWLQDVRQGEHKGTSINAIETFVGRKKLPGRGLPQS
ncbi:RNase P and RNase MRP subunit [Parahypoxylon ruwenzoriense]